MIRFQCVHCGSRIAVQSRRTDRLAVCPDCGGVTHPLAEHLQGAEKPSPAKPAAPPRKKKRRSAEASVATAAPASEPCSNCGQTLGKLQKPFTWNNHVVCGACYRQLSLDHHDAAGVPTALAVRDERVSAGPVPFISPGPSPLSDMPRRHSRLSDFSLHFWGACLGLVAAVVAIYLVVTVLQSLGTLIVWVIVALALAASFLWVRRLLSSLRSPRRVRQVQAVVKN